jgi:predicted phage-related endonuclease
VAVLLCGQRLEVHRIKRDDTLIANLIELEARFWKCVQDETPPPADGSESADQALRCLYLRDVGTTVDFSSERRLSTKFADLLALRSRIAELTEEEAQLTQSIQQAMGDASRAVFESGEVSWKRSKDSERVDLKRLVADHPDLAQRYAITKPGSRRFIVTVSS